jgi:putative ABC transport system permease protein
VIAIAVAGLGIAATLITMVYQRKRELGLLALVGATPQQMRRVIVWEAVVLGGVSQFVGLTVGLLLAYVLIFVINVQSFGWTIQYHFPWQFCVGSTVCILVVAAVFGLVPAVRATRLDPLSTVREE